MQVYGDSGGACPGRSRRRRAHTDSGAIDRGAGSLGEWARVPGLLSSRAAAVKPRRGTEGPTAETDRPSWRQGRMVVLSQAWRGEERGHRKRLRSFAPGAARWTRSSASEPGDCWDSAGAFPAHAVAVLKTRLRYNHLTCPSWFAHWITSFPVYPSPYAAGAPGATKKCPGPRAQPAAHPARSPMRGAPPAAVGAAARRRAARLTAAPRSGIRAQTAAKGGAQVRIQTERIALWGEKP
jgi:hypothetical protein